MLKLGYKASAEQFGPTRSARFLVPRRGGRVRLGLRQRPFPAVEAHRRARAERARLARRARRPHPPRGRSAPASLTPTFRYHPSIVAQVFGTLGAMFPGRVVLGVGTGESLNEVPSSGIAMAGRQGAARPAARGDRADQQIVDRGPGHLRGPVLPHRKRDDLRQAEAEGADLGRRLRPAGGADGRADRRGLHLHQRQDAAALYRTDSAKVDEGAAQRRPRRRRRSSG